MKKFLVCFMVILFSAAALAGCGNPQEPAVGDALELTGMAAEAAAVNKADYPITILTGPTSGVYFPIGEAFAAALEAYGYAATATATAASGENIKAMQNGQGELAIAMSDSVLQAYEGFGAFQGQEPATDLCAMMSLWPNYVQIVTTKDSGVKSFADLKDKQVGVGTLNSGVEINARMIFEAHGMSYDDCTVDYLSYADAIEKLKNGQCDAAFVTSGLGNKTISELGSTKDIYIVPVEGEALNSLTSKYSFFFAETIAADVYGTDADTPTVAVMNIMLVDKNLPDAVVYDMLTGIFAGLDGVQASHSAAADNIALENSLRGLTIPLHPGAEAFFTDHNVSAQ